MSSAPDLQRVRCPGCGAYVRDTGEGHYVTYRGDVHECDAKRAPEPEPAPEEERPSFEVERGIPPPTDKPSGGRKCKYPWPEMEPGDSFVVPVPEGKTAGDVGGNVQSSGKEWCDRNRPDCTARYRQVEGGVRVWLVKRPAENRR